MASDTTQMERDTNLHVLHTEITQKSINGNGVLYQLSPNLNIFNKRDAENTILNT